MTWIICDMDGTVVDSMKPLTRLGVHMMAIVSDMPVSVAEHYYADTVGQPFLMQVRKLIGYSGKADRCAEAYSEIHKLMAPMFQLTPFGDALRHVGEVFNLALVSSTSVDIIAQTPCVKTITWQKIAGYDGKVQKREQITTIMSQYCIRAEECVYVGDVQSDREIARWLGVRFSWPTVDLLTELAHGSLADIR